MLDWKLMARRMYEEMLTIKSDDVDGHNNFQSHTGKAHLLPVPESFNVLISELKSLGLN